MFTLFITYPKKKYLKKKLRLFFSFFKVHVEHSYLLHIPDEVALSNAQQGIGSVTHFMECCKNGTGSRSPIGTPVGKQINHSQVYGPIIIGKLLWPISIISIWGSEGLVKLELLY